MMIRKNDFSYSQKKKENTRKKNFWKACTWWGARKKFKHLPTYWSLLNCQRSIFLTVPLFFHIEHRAVSIKRCQMQTKQSWEFYYQLAVTLFRSFSKRRLCVWWEIHQSIDLFPIQFLPLCLCWRKPNHWKLNVFSVLHLILAPQNLKRFYDNLRFIVIRKIITVLRSLAVEIVSSI